ncbi:MAG: ABC-F family ATP-binding cassette domain-containing protein [Microcoleaceae cyanobacterium]
MTIITLQSVQKDFGIKNILNQANLSIDDSDKIGLIGTNGSGKSTLLKMLAGIEPIDAGKMWINSKANIVYLPQEPELDENNTVLEQVFAHSGEQMRLIQAYEELSLKIAKHPEDSQLMTRFSEVTQQIDALQAWELETQAKIILTQLGIEDFEVKIETLSGGYRKRIALAAALLSEPDLLLMDEPTNHLDALSVEWLQGYLKNLKGALLLITHDRYFLDQVTTRIIELDRGDLYAYEGNYSYFLEKKAEAEVTAVSQQRKHRGVLRKELEWLRRGPKARGTKQKARIQRIQAMQETDFKADIGKVEISTPSRRIGKKVIELDQVSKHYDDRVIVKDFTYKFNPDDRIGIIGKNGIGKSTLMNLVTNRVEPDSGTIDIGETIHIGYFDQQSEHLMQALNQEQRVIDYLKEVGEYVKTADGSQISASQMLERFLFSPNQQYAPLHKLSGGEKRRLFLLQVLMGAPNVLILDEPTNDLDVQTLSVLEDYLEEFNGCVITVSHDRYFLDRTVEMILSFESEGKIRQYPGNYSLYLDYKAAEEEAAKTQEVESVKPPATVTPAKPDQRFSWDKDGKRKLSSKERREYQSLEKKVAQLETEKAELEHKLYHNPPASIEALQELSQTVERLSEEIDQATLRWLELAEIDS